MKELDYIHAALSDRDLLEQLAEEAAEKEAEEAEKEAE